MILASTCRSGSMSISVT